MAAASNVQQFLEDLDEKLECPLCYNRLKDPKTLSCLHTYCLACLAKWVDEKGKLVCPTCRQSFNIPDGGLKKLPPNTFINNLLEGFEQFENADPPSCPSHKKELEFYCKVCEVPICMHCAITDHKEVGGKHEPIHISEAFKLFKQTSTELKKDVDAYKKNIKDALTKVHHKTNKLEQNREKCKKDINNFVEDMIQMITEKGEELNRNVDKIYTKKKKITDKQTRELNTVMQNVDTKWNFIAQLLKSKEATALQSSHDTITGLQKMIQKLPDTEPRDDGEMHVDFDNKYNAKSLKQKTLGFITETCSTLTSPTRQTRELNTVMQNVDTEWDFIAELLKRNEATAFQSSHDTISGLQKMIQKLPDTGPRDDGEMHVDNKYNAKSLKQKTFGFITETSSTLTSPTRQGLVTDLVRTIETHGKTPCNVVMAEDGCLLLSAFSNEIYKYKQSGEYASKITLPSNVQVDSMYKMKKNDLIVFTDYTNKCITICKSDGHVVKSIGKGILENPCGIHVDEKLNVVYVADCDRHCVFMFNMDSAQMIIKILSVGRKEGKPSQPCDVTITNEGNFIVVGNLSHRLQLFDNKGKFMKVLVGEGVQDGKVFCPLSVITDMDNNILVTSRHKLQLFNSDGHFIKRIDKQEDGLNRPYGLLIFSHSPRRVAVANFSGKNIKVFNY